MPNFMDAIIVNDNKIIISACAGIHTRVADFMAQLYAKSQRFEGDLFKEGPIPMVRAG